MQDIIAAILFGHLAGDYLLQPVAMALGKSKPGITGFTECTCHCLLYSATVCLSLYFFIGTASLAAAAAIFASHWPIDRWSLANKWMALVKSRQPLVSYTDYKEIDAAFYAIVYAVTDNALHLILMYAALQSIL